MIRTLILCTCICMLTAGCGTVAKQVTNETSSGASTIKDQSTFTEVVNSLDTPQKIYDWMGANITYRPDQTASDEFRDPETTFKLGYGDCDDYARLADYILKQHGYTTQIVSVYNSDQGHAVCVWEGTNKKLNVLSNSDIRYISAKNMMEVADAVYEDWKVYAVYPSNQGVLRTAAR